MSTANAAATLEQAVDFASDYGTGSYIISEGSTVLASYPLNGFVTSNDGADGLATANSITSQTNLADGTADTVKIVAGTKEYNLELGVDVTISDLNFIAGVTSSVSSLVVRFPA